VLAGERSAPTRRASQPTAAVRVVAATPIVAPVELRNPHPLIRAALAHKSGVPHEYGRLQFRWQGHVDIRVTQLFVRRALKILDTLFKRLEKTGVTIEVAMRERSAYERSRRCTFATDRREQVQITIKEKTIQRSNPAWSEEKRWSVDRHVYDPTGRLTLALDDDGYRWSSGRTWSDSRGHVIEEHVEEITSAIAQALVDKRLARQEAEEERKRDFERQRLRAEEQRQEGEEKQRVDQLKQWAQAWRECENLRAFMAAWEARMEADGEAIPSGSPADAWQRWVLMMIDKLDPLILD
jgi:hypothetical protein